MIFVSLGSQKFQFNRLLKYIDELIEDGVITEKVFAQVGTSEYIPQNYKYKKFLTREEFKTFISQAHTVITHGGTGAIITALKSQKYILATPRLVEFNEHVDNHQKEIVDTFYEKGFINKFTNKKELETAIKDKNFLPTFDFPDNHERYIKELTFYIFNLHKEENYDI